jgi:hypothetical protein
VEELSLSQIPDTLIESIGQAIANFSVGFVRVEDTPHGQDARLLGSGTLVTVNHTRAILTAHHVMKELPRDGRLGLILSSKPYPSTVSVEALHYLEIDRGSVNSEGPDLGAVILSPPIAGSLEAVKSFYNMAPRRNRLLNEPPDINDGVWLVHGFVAERTVDERGVEGYEKVKGFYELTGHGWVKPPYSVGKYDYYAFPVNYLGQSVAPHKFGGMSGGGLWQVPLSRNSEGELTHQTPLLSGVVFYQERIEANRSAVKCHGRRSVYEVAYEAMQKGSAKVINRSSSSI